MSEYPKFYPEVKEYISPTAFAMWHRQRSSFVRSYFKNDKSPETAAMRAGTMIHGLVQGGLLEVLKRYDHHERELSVVLPNGVKVFGKPDSFGDTVLIDKAAYFVDYKTGKENKWTKPELAADLKMLCTAWLVWNATGKPESVTGFIEWIGTEWNGSELVPTNEDHVLIDAVYSDAKLREFEAVLLKTIDDVNEEYPRFLVSTDSFIDLGDCALYADLERQIKALEKEQKVIKDRIAEQMQFGGLPSFPSEIGTFYFTERKTYDYPDELEFQLEDGQRLTLEEGERISAALSAAKKGFELMNAPKSVSKSLGFRAKKGK